MSKIKRPTRNPEDIEVLNIMSLIAEKLDINLKDNDGQIKLKETISNSISNKLASDNSLYGIIAEKMFAYISAVLGGCKYIKSEDSGDFYYSDEEEVRIPDYRVLTSDGNEFLVEVKEFNQRNNNQTFKVTKNYYNRLRNYSKMVERDLLLAIF